MAGSVNMETGERRRAVEQPVSIDVGTDAFNFSVWLPPYIANKLTKDDWVAAGKRLAAHRDEVVKRSVISGDWFLIGGVERARAAIEKGMNDLVYERFKARQVEAGETQWIVPSLLQGERFAI